MKALALVLACLLGCAANTCPKAHEVGLECHANTWRVAGIVNLARVEGRGRAPIYRGGQPSGEAWGELALTFGVTDVLKLNETEEGSDAGAEFFGIRVHHVPLPPSTLRWLSVFERPNNATMRQLIAIIEQMRRGGGVWYVHCKNGHDRTGLAIMLVRVLLDGWKPLEAYEEARRWGYHHQIPGLDEARRQYVRLQKGA